MNKYELKYLAFATVFAIVYFGFLQPFLLKSGIEQSGVYLQFLLFNVGLFVFFQLFLKALTLKTGVNVKMGLGLTFLFAALDIWAPPFAVNYSGGLIEAGVLSRSSSDYVIGYFATNSLHLSGVFVYLFTYILAPFVLLLLASKLIPNFVRSL